jgi:thiamine biosynthesis lipoprotein
MAKESFSPCSCSRLITVGKNVFMAVAVMALMVCGCEKGPHKNIRRIFALDTIIDITLYSDGPRVHRDLDSLERLIQSLDAKLSISRESSDIYRINHRVDSTQRISGALKTVLNVCRNEWKLSGGLFDITVGPLKYLYGLESHQTAHHVPSPRELDSVKSLIGFDRITFINDSVITLPKGVSLDLGGIGKGYVLRATGQFLRERGYDSFLINTGGDLIAAGTKPDRSRWRIGIQDPRNDLALIAQMSVAQPVIFTSGDYERYFIEKNVRYHHLFNPKTCLPGLLNRSATVVGDDPFAVDAAVKVAFLMSAAEAIEYLASRAMKGFIVDSGGGIWISKSLKPDLELEDSTISVTIR